MTLPNKVRSGIDGFDDLVVGGFPRSHSILVTGGTGTGKSTFALQFIYNGAKVYDEPGIYVTMEERIPSVIRNASTYGWDLDALQKKDKIALVDYSPAVAGQIRRMDVSDIFSTISSHWKTDRSEKNRNRSDHRSWNANRKSATIENRSDPIFKHAERA